MPKANTKDQPTSATTRRIITRYRTPYDEPKIVGLDTQKMIAEAEDPEEKAALNPTEQQHKDKCDINKIMQRYNDTGTIEHLSKMQPQWGDFTGAPTFMKYQNTILRGKDAFMNLNAKIRNEFDNDPAKLMDFMARGTKGKLSEEDRNLAIKIGLFRKNTPKDATLNDVLAEMKKANEKPKQEPTAKTEAPKT